MIRSIDKLLEVLLPIIVVPLVTAGLFAGWTYLWVQ